MMLKMLISLIVVVSFYFYDSLYANDLPFYPLNFERSDIIGKVEELGGKSLFKQLKSNSKETYRFTYLRSFHPAIMITINYTADGKAEIDTVSEEKLKIDERKIKSNSFKKKLGPNESKTFRDLINGQYFWNAPINMEIDDNITMMDGSLWVVEALKKGKYHIIDRRSPSPEPQGFGDDEDLIEAYKIGKRFIDLSGIDIDEIY